MSSIAKSRIMSITVLLAAGFTVFGCGGSSSSATPSTTTNTPPPAGSTPMQVSLGDAPADWIMAFGMTVNSITLTNSAGTTVNVVPTAAPMEMMQLMATVQPVSAMNVPQGSYTQAKVTFSSVSMGYMDPVSKAYATKTMPGPFTATVPFSPALTVDTTPMALNFDMNMGASVAIDGSGNVTLTPAMTAAMATLSSTGLNPWTGAMQQRLGAISSISGSQFTMGSMMGMQTTTFTTNSSTQFAGTGFTGMGSMSAGMMVSVDATVQSDGSYLAQRVESMGAGTSGMMSGGLVTTITGNPLTQLTLVASAGQGGGMIAASIGGTIAVAIPSATIYNIDSDGVDLTALPFLPTFDATSLAKGQRVTVVSGGGMITGGGGMGGGMMGSLGSLTASQLRLEPQAIRGTVSAYATSGSQATFTLTLPTDSAFTTLTGATTVQVYQQGETQFHGLTTIANSNVVVARGLLFNDAGTYRLVASWIALP